MQGGPSLKCVDLGGDYGMQYAWSRLRRSVRLWWTLVPGLALNTCVWWSYPYGLAFFILPALFVALLCCVSIPLMRRSQERHAAPKEDWRVWMVAWTGILATTPLGLFFLWLALDSTSGIFAGHMAVVAFWFLLLTAITGLQMRRLRQWQWERHNGFRPGPGLPNQ